jgi:hypothetical protein
MNEKTIGVMMKEAIVKRTRKESLGRVWQALGRICEEQTGGTSEAPVAKGRGEER